MKNRFLISLFLTCGVLHADNSSQHALSLSTQTNETIESLTQLVPQQEVRSVIENVSGFSAGLAFGWAFKQLSTAISHIAGIDGSIPLKLAAFILPNAMAYYAKKHCISIPFFKKKNVLDSMDTGNFFSGAIPLYRFEVWI